MRSAFVKALLAHVREADFAFLTGDVGFHAFEPLREAARSRFINAGIAEQNMISVAAGMAFAGLKPWVYSIAPFLYARAFEQIRNDVCMHGLPVFLVGNGGGYSYGVMGPTHHALEDYGCLLGLPKLTVYVPAFAADVSEAVARVRTTSGPAYLRLGRDETPSAFALPAYAPWRRLVSGPGATVLVVGPLAGGILAAVEALPYGRRPTLWVLSELPIQSSTVPPAFFADVQRSEHLLVAEEHVAQGSAGASLALALLAAHTMPRRFSHRCALGYLTAHSGSELYHRTACGLDPASILELLSSAP